MRVYIQSKSGDHNVTLLVASSVEDSMKEVRRLGYYFDDDKYCVPFEEIEYMKEEKK